MAREKGLRCWCLVLSTLLLLDGVLSSQDQNKSCSPSKCGIITNICHPFRLRDDPPNYGDPNYELACEKNVPLLHLYSGTYRVRGINYNNYTIRLVDPGIQEGNCSSLPRYFLFSSNFSDTYNNSNDYDSNNPYGATLIRKPHSRRYRATQSTEFSKPIFKHVAYLNCSDPVRDDAAYVDTAPCLDWESEGGGHVYAVAGDLMADQFKSGCRVKMVAPITLDWDSIVNGGTGNLSYADIHRVLSYGFEVSWWKRACADVHCPFSSPCFFDQQTQSLNCSVTCLDLLGNEVSCERWPPKLHILQDYLTGIVTGLRRSEGGREGLTYDTYYNVIPSNLAFKLGRVTIRFVFPYIIARLFLGIVFLLTLLLYTCHGRYLLINEDIEDFIQLQNLIPIRYSYKELETMTKGFKNKLGEGGFGTVFKGKLSSGPFVAIKMLGESKTNDQEFISEVSTMGRIHHQNVVHLIGFCAERSKRALVYEFMSNGSLDKYIFSKVENISLSYSKIYEISLEVARVIAYLHHGCDMQILHFDIKPHNILLDENFTPKISDFGLARLYSVDDNTITLTAARGTIGYMAPELFYKNIGGVSYKADVYSFGMLLMEMGSQRKNLNQHAEHSSQLYFPLWIYDQFDEEKDIEMEDLTEEKKDLARKMFIVALWCIQLKPADRPSLKKVIEMLEADDVRSLEMPPKPSLYPDETVLVDDRSNSNETTSTFSMCSHSNPNEDANDKK